jgi:sulfate adenylyltransferase subunit 1 (EFTu-like GTPase family)
VKRIVTWDGDIDVAFAPMSVTLVLEHELDVSRGDLLASGPVDVANRFSAQMVWMDERSLDPGRTYLLKHATRTVTAQVDAALELNQIGTVTVSTSRAIALDAYARNRTTGSFVLIDPATNFTAGAGMIVRAVHEDTAWLPELDAADRLARAAREADSHAEAIEAVRRVLEEILT